MSNGAAPAHAIGTYEEGLAWLHRASPKAIGDYPVDPVRIGQFCCMVEDANASYWDAVLAERLWGRGVAPPASLQMWVKRLPWRPEGLSGVKPMLLAAPLPGATLINVSTDIEYHRPIFVGETISVSDMATDISAEKTTRLGTGHFVTTVARYENEAGELVATATNVQFRYTPHEPAR